MARLAARLLLVACTAASSASTAWTHAESRRANIAGPHPRAASPAAHDHARFAAPHLPHAAPQPVLHHPHAGLVPRAPLVSLPLSPLSPASPAQLAPLVPRLPQPQRLAPTALTSHVPVQPHIVRTFVTTYPPAPRPVFYPPRVVIVPGPYFVVAGAGYTGTGTYPAEPGGDWSPVESVAALAGSRDVSFYCPDTREYYPAVESCASPWLKVVP